MNIVNETGVLNQKIFDEQGHMRSEVRDAIFEIVDEFCSQVDYKFDFIDIVLVGSNAGYNYTETSDLDIHLVVDFSEICRSCPEVVKSLFDAERSRFNINYDISLKGIEVEIYVEDVRAGTVSNGIYSVLEDEWVKVPSVETYSEEDVVDYPSLYDEVVTKVNQAIDSGDSNLIKQAIDGLYLIRKRGLENDGERSSGNLVFKKIRSMGLLDRLKDQYYQTRSKELSLEGLLILEV